MDISSSTVKVVELDTENEGCERKTCSLSFFNSRSRFHRFFALSFMCWLGFGAALCYDNPAALQDNLMKELNITSTQFSMLYSLYSWPPVVVCVLGGVLIDSCLGHQLGTIMYEGIALMGQIIFSLGVFLNLFSVAALGRFIFGVGSESLTVAQNAYAVAWFKGKELNLAFGLERSCSAIGIVLNFWAIDPLYAWLSNYFTGSKLLGIILFVASSTCVFSMICAVILGAIKHKTEIPLTLEKEGPLKAITLTDVKNFNQGFWLLNAVHVTYNIAIYPYQALAKVFFMNNFNMSSIEANRINSLLQFVSIFAAPLLGIIFDKLGRNLLWIFISIILTLAAHGMLAFLSWSPYIAVVMMSVASSVLPIAFHYIITLMIPTHQLGTAYGLCWSIDNLFVGFATVLSGIIVDRAGYVWLEVFFMCSLTASLIFTIILLVVNKSENGVLNMSSTKREFIQQYTKLN